MTPGFDTEQPLSCPAHWFASAVNGDIMAELSSYAFFPQEQLCLLTVSFSEHVLE